MQKFNCDNAVDPETGGGAYLISGGANGGFAAAKYVITSLNLFYDGLSAIADHAKLPIPGLQKVLKYIQIAKFVVDLLDKGLECTSNYAGVASFIILTTFISLLMVQIATTLYNPIAAFVVNVAFYQAVDWLIGQSENC